MSNLKMHKRAASRQIAKQAIVAALLSTSTIAHAQNATSGDAEATGEAEVGGEILVTATRQTQALSRVPISIVAKDQEALDKQGIRSMSDIARLTPGLTFGQTALYFGTGQSVISIRGVQSDSGIPTTGIYIDDTPIQTRTGISPSLTNPYPEVFDLDRVEVLRGPQGTLFGSGSVGGAVRFITPKPSLDSLSLYGRSEIAGTQHGAMSYEGGVGLGAPIVEGKLGFRASAWYRHDGGYVDRLDRYSKQLIDKDIDSKDSFSTRVALGWQATENLTLTPSVFYQNVKFDDSSRFELAQSDIAHANYRTSLSRIPENRKDRFVLPALKAELELDGMSLVSNTSYFKRKTSTRSDDVTLSLGIFGSYPGGDFPAGFENYQSGTNSSAKQRIFSQEVRLQNDNPGDRFNWVAGLFYMNGTTRETFGSVDPDLLDVVNFGQTEVFGDDPFPTMTDAFGTELYRDIYSVYQKVGHKDRQIAAFAQADFEIVPRLRLTAGLRYTDAKYDFSSFIAGPLYSTDGINDRISAHSKSLTPKFGVTFQADRNNMFYANAAKGVRGSGVASAVGAACAADAAAIGFDPNTPNIVDPDSIWSYEIGSKNRLAGGRLQLDISAYRVDWKNVQTLFTLPACQLYTTLNLGNAKIDGVDFALSAKPTDNLTLGVSASYINARYTTSVIGPEDSVIRKAGEPFPVVPWSLQLNGEYVLPIDRVDGYVRADFTYTSHDDTPLDVNSPLVDPDLPRAPATTMLNMRVGARFDDVDVSLFMNNVTNSHPVQSLTHDTVGNLWYRGSSFRPRTVGLTVTMHR
ncbi:TonB-dependent receptor [Novosphingobium mathurense]|uniref:Outer membrane receptor proteins, mostly Fe transport n=1 Tax=Novosphingobium mathurense TaxID=428990 RepID=A0A1U6IVK7_9SPHN|nr:TonB-dependent receptor [Novosphingobium mathurense]SLK12021.1 Outer membrane receptor proteins, mostly Fe transport [Novosphingobium mathurense]